jgi:hypothetical protein
MSESGQHSGIFVVVVSSGSHLKIPFLRMPYKEALDFSKAIH